MGESGILYMIDPYSCQRSKCAPNVHGKLAPSADEHWCFRDNQLNESPALTNQIIPHAYSHGRQTGIKESLLRRAPRPMRISCRTMRPLGKFLPSFTTRSMARQNRRLNGDRLARSIHLGLEDVESVRSKVTKRGSKHMSMEQKRKADQTKYISWTNTWTSGKTWSN